MTGKDDAALWYFGLVLILSLPFYVLGVTRLSLPFAPALPISALMACLPMLVALTLVARQRGTSATRALLVSAFHAPGILRATWILVALGVMPLAFAVTAGVIWLSRSDLPALALLPPSAILPAFLLFFLGAVAEEIGWQGYALPRLTRRHSALSAALAIGAVWAIWHVVPLVLAGRAPLWILWHGLAMILMRIVMVWLVTNAGQSLLIAVLFHMMSNSVWGLFGSFDPYYSPALLFTVLFGPVAALVWLCGPSMRLPAPDRRPLVPNPNGWKVGTRARRVLFSLGILLTVAVAGFLRFGLPMLALPIPIGVLIGAEDAFVTDASRPDLFSGAPLRVVPFQILYPAREAGSQADYLPDAGPQIDAMVQRHGWISRAFLGGMGRLRAPWTDAAQPAAGGPFPIILYLPGVTGYMQMGSFETTALAARGYIVVTLNQPGAVAATVLPGGQIIKGLTRDEATGVIAPSYRKTGEALPPRFAKALAADGSILPYFAADVGVVLGRLAQINGDPADDLHGMLDLDHVGSMGMSLGALVTAQACSTEARIDACVMMDAPVPTDVARKGLRQPALWISRPSEDQRLERKASGGWPEDEIAAQASTIAEALSHSEHGRLVELHGLFHVDFTDLPAMQPALGWLGQSGPVGAVEAHRQINELILQFFAATLGAKR